MNDRLVVVQLIVVDLNECTSFLFKLFVVKEQFLEEVIVCLNYDFSLPSHGRSTSFEDHLIIDLESSLVLREHSAWWLLLDAF